MKITIIITVITAIVFYLLGRGTSRQRRKYETKDINNQGELLVSTALKKHFARKSNYIFNNVTLPTYDNGSTQIDHILINQYGVFVIESKHYSGWVFADKNNQQWTQRFSNGQTFQFFSPIKQNEGHIKQLSRHLKYLPLDDFISIIVFTGEAEIKTSVGENVLYLRELIKHIKTFHAKKLTTEQIQTSIGTIEFNRKEESEKTDLEHIKYVKRLRKYKKD